MKKYLTVDHGLLALRVGIGFMFLGHGIPKLMAGPALWTKIGGAMGAIGITFFPSFWGFMASISEALGGLFIMLGIFTRPAAGFMAFTMLIASIMHLGKGDGFFQGASHAIESLVVFVSLILAGSGKFSLKLKK